MLTIINVMIVKEKLCYRRLPRWVEIRCIYLLASGGEVSMRSHYWGFSTKLVSHLSGTATLIRKCDVKPDAGVLLHLMNILSFVMGSAIFRFYAWTEDVVKSWVDFIDVFAVGH